MKTFDREREDLGNSIHLEHLNLTVPDQQLATLFYISGLGLTRDPYLVTGLENMWVNVGRSQFHLPINKPQTVRGHTGLVMPDLEALLARLNGVKERLSGTRFTFEKQRDFVQLTCPWGNRIHCYAPNEERFGEIVLGMPYIAFDVPKGSVQGIARFYDQVIGAPSTLENGAQGASVHVKVGVGQQLIFNETDASTPPYDGHHIQIYVANFSGPYRKLKARDQVSEESNQHQYRFKQIFDPENGQPLYELEHEVRSVTHPLYARPLVNRNAMQSNNNYKPGHDAAAWARGHL